MSQGRLIDTNVVSEWIKPRSDTAIVSWLDVSDEDRIFLSGVSLTEIRFGIEGLAPGHPRTRLDQWLLVAGSGLVSAGEKLSRQNVSERAAVGRGRKGRELARRGG